MEEREGGAKDNVEAKRIGYRQQLADWKTDFACEKAAGCKNEEGLIQELEKTRKYFEAREKAQKERDGQEVGVIKQRVEEEKSRGSRLKFA